MRRFDTAQPILAGLVSAVVGFASAFTVVLAGLRAVGASPAQAASGLLVLCVGIAATTAFLALRHRMPISTAWSTPGAALLVTTSHVQGGWPAAVGAFLVAAALIVVAGLSPWLARAIAAIPRPIAGAMLAGVILSLCTAPVRAVVDVPELAVPVVLTWALLTRFARQWAVPGALLAAVVAIAVRGVHLTGVSVAPAAVFTVPTFTVPALVSIAVPLFLVTMAAQNVPGMAVMATYGYTPPLRGVLVTTGVASALAAPFGGHALNLAAITAALTAGPDAHPDPRRRWVGATALAAGQLALGLGAGLAMALVLLSPPVLVIAVAGLALLSALGTSLVSAVTEPAGREAAVVTFVVTASGTTILNVGPAFWGLVAGGLTALLLHRRRGGTASADSPTPATVATAGAADGGAADGGAAGAAVSGPSPSAAVPGASGGASAGASGGASGSVSVAAPGAAVADNAAVTSAPMSAANSGSASG